MASMLLDETCSPGDLQISENHYHVAIAQRRLDKNIQFQYAWCLVRTADRQKLQTGSNLLQDLFRKSKDDSEKRDYLYYMVIASAKLKEYETSLKYADGILKVQPSNRQVIELKAEINKRMKRDGAVGMAVAGGAAAVLGAGLVTLIGLAIAKKTTR